MFRSRQLGGWWFAVLGPWLATVWMVTAASPPHLDHRERRLQAPPAGEPAPSPAADDCALLVAWFGPSDPADPMTGDLWVAAKLAFDEANAAGGVGGRKVALCPCWSANPWGTGVARLFRLVYDQPVVAVLGSVDGPSTHLAEQVVAKARLPLVSPVAGDGSVNFAGVPWMFSCAPSEEVWAPGLADAVVEARRGRVGPFVLVNATDHDSRRFADATLRALAQRQASPARRLEFTPGGDTFEVQLRTLVAVRPAVLVLLADAVDSATFLAGVRRRGLRPVVFGSPALGRRGFRERAGAAAQGVRFPATVEPEASRRARERFAGRFQALTGHAPDEATRRTHDAARLLLAALAQGGTDRRAVREALVQLSPWSGLTGRIEFDGLGRNVGAKVCLKSSRSDQKDRGPAVARANRP